MTCAPSAVAIGLLAAALAAGAGAQSPDTTPPAAAPLDPLPPQSTAAELGQPFATKHAAFEPRAFDDLPGWRNDSLPEATEGMRQSCAALQRKPVWGELCAEFARTSGDHGGMRAFFERNFYVYQILAPGGAPDGKLTGYFEPLLEGSRQRDARFKYPVYGLPGDLYLLDARSAGGVGWLRREGNRLKPAAVGSPGAHEYEIALGGMGAGIRDKRYRVRIEGRRVVPYWSRQDIERRAIDASVLAWVDDAHKLYSMQVQGSGKIGLREGGTVRVAYAEQNGHPFRPRVTRGDVDFALTEIKARGLIAGSASSATLAQPSASVPAPVNAEVARIIARLKGGGGGAPAPRPAAAVPTATPAATATAPSTGGSLPVPAQSQDVAEMIAVLKGQRPAPAPRPIADAPATGTAPAAGADSVAVSQHAGGITGIPDPSYVFFRNIDDGPQGPIGALGVPLSAERSIAVDPRTTPLGAPVFIASKQPSGDGPMQKLMFAQDTGGAIRGSVRADFYWGFGDTAGRLALATNENLRMWLLLPKRQMISAVAASGMKLRGRRSELPECVIADPDLCVEE